MADLEENARRKAAGKKEIVISPVAMEIVRRIDALFEIERSINGQNRRPTKGCSPGAERAARRRSGSLYARAVRQALPRSRSGQGMNYMFKRWASFTRFLEDGRVCLLEQCRRKSAARHRIGQKVVVILWVRPRRAPAAAMYSLIVSAKMNDVDPQAWLADVLARIATHPAHRLDELLPWELEDCATAAPRRGSWMAMSLRCSVKTRNGCSRSPKKWTPRMASYGSSASVKTA